MFVVMNGSFISMAIIWLIAMVVLLIIEAIVPGLVSIWFAIGALAALIVALVGGPLWLQVVWFLIASIALLFLTRPLAKKYVNSRIMPTNADMILGKECVVTEKVDNLRGTGAVSVGGKVWTARMDQDEMTAEEGEVLCVKRIEGVKLIVSQKSE